MRHHLISVSPKRHVNRHNRHHAPVSKRGVAKAFPRRWQGVSGTAETPLPASQIASTHFSLRADTDKSASTPSHRLTETFEVEHEQLAIEGVRLVRPNKPSLFVSSRLLPEGAELVPSLSCSSPVQAALAGVP